MPARILVIEDNPANMDLMVYLLQAFGHSAVLAYDGEEGVAAARREHPDLVICDIHLPRMDGYAVLRELRSDPAFARVPVIAVTALAMVGDREKLLDAGFDGYIGKPVEPEAFMAKIGQLLGTEQRAVPSSEAPGASAAEALPRVPANGIRVLMVDDAPVNRELVVSTLGPLGYEVVVTETVAAALERLQASRFDLILCDLHLPKTDGLDFLSMMKADPQMDRIPFLMISSTISEEADHRLALELGADQLIRRPIEPQALLARIEDCLKSRVRI